VRISSKTADEVSALLRGEPGSEVRLYVSQHVNARSDLLAQSSAPYAFQSLPRPAAYVQQAEAVEPPPPSQPPADAVEVVGYRSEDGSVGLSFAKGYDTPQDGPEQEWYASIFSLPPATSGGSDVPIAVL
jgi:hypothetical protein